MMRRYVVKLPPGEVLARLAGNIDPIGLFGQSGSGNRPLYGRVRNSTFEIQLRTGIGGSFKPLLSGRVDGTSEGSSIRVKAGMNSFAAGFTLVWLAGTVGFQVFFLLAALIGEEAFRGWIVLAPSGMTLFGLLFYRVGKAISQPEAERLLAQADQLWGPPQPEGQQSDEESRVSG